MSKFYFKKARKFVDFPKNQVRANDYGEGGKYILIEGDKLARYNECVQNGLSPTKEYVVDNNQSVKSALDLRKSKNEAFQTLEANFLSKARQGFTYKDNVYGLDEMTVRNIDLYNGSLEKDDKIDKGNPNHQRKFPNGALLSDATGVQRNIALNEWDDFYIEYAGAYGTLMAKRIGAENQIRLASTIAAVAAIDLTV